MCVLCVCARLVCCMHVSLSWSCVSWCFVCRVCVCAVCCVCVCVCACVCAVCMCVSLSLSLAYESCNSAPFWYVLGDSQENHGSFQIYGTGVPLLYFVSFIGLYIQFVSTKYLVLRFYKRPPLYSADALKNTPTILVLLLIIHAAFGTCESAMSCRYTIVAHDLYKTWES